MTERPTVQVETYGSTHASGGAVTSDGAKDHSDSDDDAAAPSRDGQSPLRSGALGSSRSATSDERQVVDRGDQRVATSTSPKKDAVSTGKSNTTWQGSQDAKDQERRHKLLVGTAWSPMAAFVYPHPRTTQCLLFGLCGVVTD